eukprot:6210988-Prymnesium_polylepis.1
MTFSERDINTSLRLNAVMKACAAWLGNTAVRGVARQCEDPDLFSSLLVLVPDLFCAKIRTCFEHV